MGDKRNSDQMQPKPSVEEVHGHLEGVRVTLEGHINEKLGLKEWFYKDGLSADHMNQAMKMFVELKKKECSTELALSLTILVLYDLVILIDDSLSMRTEEGGNRIKALKLTLLLIAEVYTLARSGGILVIKFLNDSTEEMDVRTDTVAEIISEHNFTGWTRIGTELEQKVLNCLVKDDMKKPLLVLTITDGEIEGEDKNALVYAIDKCIKNLKEGPHGEPGAHAVSFQFAKVGNDPAAADFLHTIDNHETIGQYVDCLPVGIEVLLDEKKWTTLTKMLLGGMVKTFGQVDGMAARGLDDVQVPEKTRKNRHRK